MSVQSREAKVFAALLLSMTLGAIVLMALGNNPPSAGAFCLSRYYFLQPVEKVILSKAVQSSDRWNSIEVYYSGTKAGNIEQLTSLSGLTNPGEINCHFVICNGIGGGDGQIQPTDKWQRQWSVVPPGPSLRSTSVNISGQTQPDSRQTIYICIIADPAKQPTNITDCQVKRTKALIEELCRKFDIPLRRFYYPNDWL